MITDTTTYAEAVVAILCEHFPDVADPVTSAVLTKAITRQAANPQPSFEVIVDDPFSARWRLKPKPGRDQGRVRLRCYRLNRRPSDGDLEDAANAALEALEASCLT